MQIMKQANNQMQVIDNQTQPTNQKTSHMQVTQLESLSRSVPTSLDVLVLSATYGNFWVINYCRALFVTLFVKQQNAYDKQPNATNQPIHKHKTSDVTQLESRSRSVPTSFAVLVIFAINGIFWVVKYILLNK